MRDLIVFSAVFATIPFIFKRPVVGILVYAWLSLMNPHRLTFGAAFDFPFAAIVGIVTIFATILKRDSYYIPQTTLIVLLIVFSFWMTFTTFFALVPELAWREWNRVMKTFLMFFITVYVINNKREIVSLAFVIALSIGFYGFKGGIFTLASGGNYRVLGPVGTYIGDNNDLAFALVVVTPMIWYLYLQTSNKLLSKAFAVMAGLTVVAAIGSYSRGALLAGLAMLFVLWLNSRHKVRTTVFISLVIPFVFIFMPDQWFDRMSTIGDYEQDGSALGRINSWGFAINVATNNILGGGFNVFSPEMFLIYGPDPLQPRAAHSIYFRVLGEHGFIGLFIFALFLFESWRTTARLKNYYKERYENRWGYNLASMAQVSIVGFLVGGSFLSLSYFDLFFYIVALIILLDKIRFVSTKGTTRISNKAESHGSVVSSRINSQP